MAIFQLVIALLTGGCLLSLLAGRLGLPYPALLAIAGAGLALVPGVPEVALDPALALALLVAPVLLDAAYDTSLRDLRDNWRPVASLSVLLVCVTTAVVAVVARWLVPDMPWPIAVALGATVSPPDAAAATAVLRRLAPPHRVLVVLEGESLLNDATALLIWRLAIGAAVSGSLSWTRAAPLFLLTSVGGVAAGYLLARAYMRLTRRVDDMAVNILLQFLGCFGVWLLADRLGLSAVITTVTYGLTIAQHAPRHSAARLRLTAFSVWEVAVFGLNVLAFILVGLQLRGILHRIDGHLGAYLAFAAAICATVVVVRFAWVETYISGILLKNRLFGVSTRRPMMLPSHRSGALVAWCGMRGIVTLATALALPERAGQGALPYRDLLVFAAFAVVLATLALQGLTLPALLSRLHLADDGSVGNEVRLARAATARAALRALDGDGPEYATLRRDYAARIHRAESGEHAADRPDLALARRGAVDAERAALMDLRAREAIGDAAFRRVEEELDLAEVEAAIRLAEQA